MGTLAVGVLTFFKYQPHKMVKHIKPICRQEPTNCSSVFDHFVRLVLKFSKMYVTLSAIW